MADSIEPQPPTSVELAWREDLRFGVSFPDSPGLSMSLDSAGKVGPSPVQTMAVALAGCLSMDVVHILTKGRHVLTALSVHLTGDRRLQDPRRFERITLHYTIHGSAPREAVQRAIDLSRERYCSVWHSMRQDIELRVTFDVEDGR